MWSLGAERGVTGGGKKETGQESKSCSEALFCQQEDLGFSWGKYWDDFQSSRTFWLCGVKGLSLCASMALRAAWACGGAVRWSPALPGDTATCQETGLGSEVGCFWFWTAGKSLFFFLNLDCCLHKLWSFCTVCVPFFPFMQSFSALAAKIV